MTGSRGPLEMLTGALSADEMRRVAGSLEIDGSVPKAVREVAVERREGIGETLGLALAFVGGVKVLAQALRAMASVAAQAPPPPQLVWSGPDLPGDSNRTTEAIVRLIDEAEESVLASTYSASASAPFVQALTRASRRGLRIKLVVDVVKLGNAAMTLAHALPRAEILGYHYSPDSREGLQHSKLLVIDGRYTLVTSANLSAAAVERNLEAGVLVDSAATARLIAQRIADLVAEGYLRAP